MMHKHQYQTRIMIIHYGNSLWHKLQKITDIDLKKLMKS